MNIKIERIETPEDKARILLNKQVETAHIQALKVRIERRLEKAQETGNQPLINELLKEKAELHI